MKSFGKSAAMVDSPGISSGFRRVFTWELHFLYFPAGFPGYSGWIFHLNLKVSFSRENPPDFPPVSIWFPARIHPSAGIPAGFLVDPGRILLPVAAKPALCYEDEAEIMSLIFSRNELQ